MMRHGNKSVSSPLDLNHLRELLFHVDNAIHSRVNLQLLVQSVFFAALAQVWASQGNTIKFILVAVGVTLTLVLWYPTVVLQRRSRFLARALCKQDRTYEYYLRCLPGKRVATQVLAYALPVLFLLAWLAVWLVLAGYIK